MAADLHEVPLTLPLLDRETGWFWTAGAEGRLLIARCGACGRWQHPPLGRCAGCGGAALAPAPVSGRGRIATFTVNYERWLPGLPVPYVYGVVELEEQAELYVHTNILAPPEAVAIAMPVAVCFEQREDVWLPMFRPVEAADADR